MSESSSNCSGRGHSGNGFHVMDSKELVCDCGSRSSAYKCSDCDECLCDNCTQRDHNGASLAKCMSCGPADRRAKKQGWRARVGKRERCELGSWQQVKTWKDTSKEEIADNSIADAAHRSISAGTGVGAGVYCEQHPSPKDCHELTLLCKSCDNLPICLRCAALEHRCHDYEELLHLSDPCRREIVELICEAGAGTCLCIITHFY